MHGNQWVLKIAVLKYYSVSKRGTTAKSNPKQATDPISLHTKFGDNSSNTFPLNERKPCVAPDIGRRTAEKTIIIYPPPRGVDIISNYEYIDTLNECVLQCYEHCMLNIFRGYLNISVSIVSVLGTLTGVAITSLELWKMLKYFLW